MREVNRVPWFAKDAKDYPARATELEHLSLSFYCINCQRKADTEYLTPNFGPFCADCIRELEVQR